MKKYFLWASLGLFSLCVLGYFVFFSQPNYRALYAKPIENWPKPIVDEGVEYQEMRPLESIAPQPVTNIYTKEKRLLGEFLFEEPMLSRSKQIACASCHNKELGFGDGLKTSFGHSRQRGNRNAPNIMMSGFYDKLFWDGRADNLEEQILGPIHNPIEMAYDIELALKNIEEKPLYQNLFLIAFGDSDFKLDSKSLLGKDFVTKQDLAKLSQKPLGDYKKFLTTENLLKAIATYERSLPPKNTRFNRFLNGDYKALTDKEIYGLHLFRTKAKCMNCHYGMILSDSKFHNLGLSFYGRALQDLGRYEITKDENDLGAFKTPSLIAVSKSAPYMHNGIFPNLRGLLNMYNNAFSKDRIKQEKIKISPLIHKLNLSREEIEALEDFLKTL